MGASAPAELANEPCRMSDWGLLDMRSALAKVGGTRRGTAGCDAGSQRRRTIPRIADQPRAGAGARADCDLGGVLAVGACAVQVPGVVVLARARSADAGDHGVTFPPAAAGPACHCRAACLRNGGAGACDRIISDPTFTPISPTMSSPRSARPCSASDSATIPSPRAARWKNSTSSIRTCSANPAGSRPSDVGGNRIGHEGFFASRHRDSLWRPVIDWLDSRLGVAA